MSALNSMAIDSSIVETFHEKGNICQPHGTSRQGSSSGDIATTKAKPVPWLVNKYNMIQRPKYSILTFQTTLKQMVAMTCHSAGKMNCLQGLQRETEVNAV